jgi:hypothetical protein
MLDDVQRNMGQGQTGAAGHGGVSAKVTSRNLT